MSPGAGDVVADRFEVERVAGAGGMGTVYRARDLETGQTVALKLLEGQAPMASERFTREARVLAELRHPGIVRYIANGKTSAGQMYLAMEWLDGESLAQRLGREGLSMTDSLALVGRVAEAVGAAHARGIVHRDVKPSNLFLHDGRLDQVRVLDFGVARVSSATRGATHTGVMLGTPGYMAPEQARGERRLDARADVFALGCVLFECLTGRPVFVGEHVMALLAKILLEEAPRVRELRADVPEPVDALVARLLAKEVEARPRDGAAVAALIAGLGGVALADADVAPSRPAALTASEQHLLCVVLASNVGPVELGDDLATFDDTATGADPPTLTSDRTEATDPADAPVEQLRRDALAPTLAGAEASSTVDRLAVAVGNFGAHLERLANGSVVVTLSGKGATDQAAQAARCALAMHTLVPDAPMALATGRGVIAGRWPVGEAIDRAARLLRSATPDAVRLDEVTAGLLDVRFDVGGDRVGLYLRGEREVVESARTLLGKNTPTVGRDRELGVLSGLFEECVAEPVAHVVLLTGGAGVGKSRVRYELLRKVLQRDDEVEVWIGRGDPLTAGAPFGMIAPALRRAAGVLDGEPPTVRQQKLRARVARHVTPRDLRRVSEFLGELVGVPFPDADSVELRAARGDALLMGDQMRRAFEDLIDAETAAGPLLIVLEDLHWGDLPTVKFLDSALRHLQDRPWMVLALARPEVHELFPSLWSERRVQEIRLGELTRRGSERLVRQVLGEQVDAATVARLVERAAGNAFYLEELIRSVAEGKGDRMPETVLAVVQARLERLEGDARRLLRAASVFGQVFWEGGVRVLLGGEDRTGPIDAWLDELLEREVIVRRGEGKFPGEEEFSFRHALVRDAAYGMLTDADRVLGHKLAGQWLERAGEAEAVVLAEHIERGGEPARAVAWYRRAAEQALGGSDLRAAIGRASHGIACGAQGDVLGALLLVQAQASSWLGEFSAAERLGLEAMRCLPPGDDRWFDAASEMATGSGKVASVERLVELGERLASLEGPPRSGAQVHAFAHAAFQLYFSGQYDLAGALLERIEQVEPALRERDPMVLARVQQARASRSLFGGDSGAYLELEQASIPCFEQAGDLRNACAQRGYVGYACIAIGAYDEAERWLRGALATAERMGLHNVAATARHNLGMALALSGAGEEGRAVETQAIAMFRAQGDRRLEGASHTYLGRILALAGELDEAESELRLAVELLRSSPPSRAQALALLAEVRMRQGEVDDALLHIREAVNLLESLGSVEEGESLILLIEAQVLEAAGRHDQAQGAIATAGARLLARAGKISDADWRRSFLERVPENARTLVLASSWLGHAQRRSGG